MSILSSSSLRKFVLLAMVLPFVAGCESNTMIAYRGVVKDPLDPLDLPYHWRPKGVYQANIAAMVERKSDLISGRPRYTEDGHHAAEAVQRWRDDKLRPFPNLGGFSAQNQGGNGAGVGSVYR
ncbi:MAG: hypothetical protein J6P29_02450 [Acetobacter sp.]|nr:hypothetical protein [Acetobacter sp.]